MKVRAIIQRVTALLIFLTGFIFGNFRSIWCDYYSKPSGRK